MVLAVLQKFTGVEGFAAGLEWEEFYPLYFEFVTKRR
jgi:hypothetical protein